MNLIRREGISDTLLLNVAVIPPDHVANEAIDLSARTCAFGGLFELDRTARFPHMTIYMARFSYSKIDAVRGILSATVPTFEEVALDHNGYYVTPIKYYEVSYAKSPGLERMQDAIAKGLRGLRYAPGNPIIENYFGSYQGDTKKNAEAWGYDLIGDLYRPHITLTRFPADFRIDPQMPLRESPDDLSFPLSSIGLFRADDMGAARELISEWKLGSSNL